MNDDVSRYLPVNEMIFFSVCKGFSRSGIPGIKRPPDFEAQPYSLLVRINPIRMPPLLLV